MHGSTNTETGRPQGRQYDHGEIKLFEEWTLSAARKSFWAFRCFMRPDMKRCWWQKHFADRLQNFYERMILGKRPKLVATAPPQHGKSDSVKDFCAWVAGKNPKLREMFTSYSEDLGIGANLHLQRMMSTPKYQAVFFKTQLPVVGSSLLDQQRYKRNSSLLEFVGQGGCFYNTTVNGQINGFGLDFGVIDDPIKGRKEAQSKTVRDSTWSWMLDDFFMRFSEYAGLVMIVTRWHVDDPVGRWLQHFPDTELLKYKAFAPPDDWSVREGYRRVGEPLFPEHKSADFLNERRRATTQASWESQFQQEPFVVGGGQLPIDKLRIMPSWSSTDPNIMASVRYWDKAGTVADDASWTAGVLMHRMRDGRFIISHVVHGQWTALERESKMKLWSQTDAKMYRNYSIGIEQEPGSGGKESAENTVRNLAGFTVFVDKVHGSKALRAEPFAAQVQGGNVWLVAGDWVTDYLDEAEVWPQGHDDQIDGSSGAFNRLASTTTFDTSYRWVTEDR